MVRLEVEDELFAAQEVLNLHKLHGKIHVANHLPAGGHFVLEFVINVTLFIEILHGGQSHNAPLTTQRIIGTALPGIAVNLLV